MWTTWNNVCKMESFTGEWSGKLFPLLHVLYLKGEFPHTGRHSWTDELLIYIKATCFAFSLLNSWHTNCFLFCCASKRIHRVRSSSDCSSWVSFSLLRSTGSVGLWIAFCSQHAPYSFCMFFTSAWHKSCWNMLERVYFYPRVFQFSPACRVAGEATLMILISQTAWIQTGILPLQLLLSVWCSPALVCLSHSSSLCHFLSSLTSTCAVGFIVSSFIVSLFVSRCSPSSCLTLCTGK